MADASPAVQKTAVPSKQPILKRQREVDSETDDEPRLFRRVRMKCRQQARKEDCQDEAESEALSGFGKGTIRCICGGQDKVRTLGDYSDRPLSAGVAGNWLIQCIDCKVWQHRSCVGAANANDPPSGYRCEQCLGLLNNCLHQDCQDLLQKLEAQVRELKSIVCEGSMRLKRVRSSRSDARKIFKATIAGNRAAPASLQHSSYDCSPMGKLSLSNFDSHDAFYVFGKKAYDEFDCVLS